MTDCIFLRRGYHPDRLTLKSLFETATVTPISNQNHGANDGTWGNTDVYLQSVPDTGLQGLNAYAFVFHNGNIGIWKIQNRAIVTTPILQSNSNKCGLSAYSSSGQFYYYDGGYTTGSYGGTYVYGGTMVVIVFSDNYSSADIDNLLSNATVTSLAGADSSNTSTVRTSDKSKTVYLTACGNTMDAWVASGTTYENIYKSYTPSGQYGPQPSACLDGNYLRAGATTSASVYSATIIGLS